MKPTLFLFAAGLAAGLTGLVPAASAASCWDLWYERNAIYDPQQLLLLHKSRPAHLQQCRLLDPEPDPEPVGTAPGGPRSRPRNAAAAAKVSN